MHSNKNKVMIAVDKNFMTVFASFIFGFLLSFFICWNTIIYIITLFERVNGLV